MFKYLTLLLLVTLSTFADTLILNDGSKQEGTVTEEDNSSITLKVKFGVVRFKKSEVKEIIRTSTLVATIDASELRDVLKLKNGIEHVGLLAVENGGDVEFDVIASGKAVSRTMLLRTRYSRGEIAELKLLTAAQRKAVREHIEKVSAVAQQDAVEETKVLIEDTTLPTTNGEEWTGRKIETEHFTLISNIDPEFHKKAAYRLSRVFAAYKQHFGIDRSPEKKFKVLILNSMEEYSQYTNGVKNPAFYSLASKQIVAGCNVAAIEEQVKEIKAAHAVLNGRVNDWKAKIKEARAKVQAFVSRVYEMANRGGKGATGEGQAVMDEIKYEQQQWQIRIGEFEKKLTQVQDEITALDKRNEMVFNENTKKMFSTIYHEGFHAFADVFLLAENQSRHIPRWLHEGLAQYFELGRLEGNKFILGVEDRNRLALLRRFKKENALMTLENLLSANAQDFLVHGEADLENSAKSYLQSWLLIQVLDENKRLSREHLQSFIRQLAAGKAAIEALPLLSGMTNADLEKAMNDRLKPNFGR